MVNFDAETLKFRRRTFWCVGQETDHVFKLLSNPRRHHRETLV